MIRSTTFLAKADSAIPDLNRHFVDVGMVAQEIHTTTVLRCTVVDQVDGTIGTIEDSKLLLLVLTHVFFGVDGFKSDLNLWDLVGWLGESDGDGLWWWQGQNVYNLEGLLARWHIVKRAVRVIYGELVGWLKIFFIN